MTFRNLHNALENNQIINKNYKEIVKLILEAERDWVVPVSNLDEFNSLIEDEIGGIATENNLSKLQKKYLENGFANSAWNTESICSLLEIFKLTKTENLKTLFTELSNKINNKK
jgi:hypothetical protein